MRVYHDWEFLETENSVYPISVGMVREDGKELYYEFANAPWDQIFKHEWLKANVVPKLICAHDGSLVRGEATETFKSSLAIMGKVRDFLSQAYLDGGEKIELWGWYSGYDHVCLGQLFGAMVNFPSFVPMWTNDIRQEVYRLGDPIIPDFREFGELVHNALDDAKAELRMHNWLIEFAETRQVHINNSRGIQYGSGNSQFNTF
jgi:hypothetical protein